MLADTEFSISASSIGILVMMGVSVSGVIQVPMGWVADQVNRKAMVVVGGLVVAGSVYSFVHATGFNYLFWASVVFGIGGGVSMPALMAAAVLRGSHIDAMGSVMSLLTAAHSLGMLVGSVLAGVLMDLFQLRQAFCFGSVAMAVGTVLFVICTWRSDLSEGTVLSPPPQIPEG